MELMVIDNDSFPYLAFLTKRNLYLYTYINSIAFITLSLFLLIFYFIEYRLCNPDSNRTRFYLMLARYIVLLFICLIGFLEIKNGLAHFFWLAMIFLTIVPWGLLTSVRNRILTTGDRIKGILSDESSRETKNAQGESRFTGQGFRGLLHDKSMLWIAFSGITLTIFIYALFSDSSFLWAMYEERDFLEGLRCRKYYVFSNIRTRATSGRTNAWRDSIYIPCPLCKNWGRSTAFAILNKFLFVVSAILIWIILNRYVSRISASLGLLLFCSSSVIRGFAYWPIHPCMSITFYLLFIFLVLRGFLDGSRISIILSGVALSILVQFHFSYYTLLLAYVVVFLVRRSTSINTSNIFVFHFIISGSPRTIFYYRCNSGVPSNIRLIY